MTKRLHALWILASTDMHGDKHLELLASKDPKFRAWGARALNDIPENAQRIASLTKDASPDVQVQVAIAARKLKGVDPLPVLLDVLNNSGADKLIPHIVWQNLHPLLEERSDDFLKQVAKLDLEKSANVLNLMPRVVDRILAVKKQDPQALVSLVTVLSESPKSRDSAAKVLGTLNAKVQTGELAGDNLKALETRLLPVVKKLQFAPNLTLASEATLLGAVLKDETCLQTTREMLTLSIQPDGLRLKALEALIAAGDGSVLEISRDLLKNPKTGSAAFRGNMLAALGKFDNPKVASLALDNYKTLEPDLQPRAIELLTQRSAWSKQLLGDIEAKKIPASAVNVNQIRKLLALKDAAMTKRVEAIWGTIREARNPQREKVVAQMRDVIAKTPGDPNKGALIYKKLCAQCHKLHGEGADVGPDITSNGRSDFEQLLSNVFDPSLVIGLGYRQTNVVTAKGQVINGLLVEDSPQRVVLKTQGGKIETIARGNVDEVTTSPLSYMPEDVERQLSPQEIADLFALLVLDRPPSDPAARKIPGTPR